MHIYITYSKYIHTSTVYTVYPGIYIYTVYIYPAYILSKKSMVSDSEPNLLYRMMHIFVYSAFILQHRSIAFSLLLNLSPSAFLVFFFFFFFFVGSLEPYFICSSLSFAPLVPLNFTSYLYPSLFHRPPIFTYFPSSSSY